MIGVYDYTVILTYASLVSGILGIVCSVTGAGHPVLGLFFLMLSGMLDAFDGRVARTKKNRSEFEKNFGVQIDSLCDMICFGVLPATIGLARLRVSGIFTEIVSHKEYEGNYALLILFIIIAVFYVLSAMIRLAYFNSTIEIREEGSKKLGYQYFIGLPVTSAALVFPLVMVIQMFVKRDLVVPYFILMLIMAIAFIMNIRIRKPGKVGLIVIMIIGIIEFIITCLVFYLMNRAEFF